MTKCLVEWGLVNLFLWVPLTYPGSKELGCMAGTPVELVENSLQHLLNEVFCHAVDVWSGYIHLTHLSNLWGAFVLRQRNQSQAGLVVILQDAFAGQPLLWRRRRGRLRRLGERQDDRQGRLCHRLLREPQTCELSGLTSWQIWLEKRFFSSSLLVLPLYIWHTIYSLLCDYYTHLRAFKSSSFLPLLYCSCSPVKAH